MITTYIEMAEVELKKSFIKPAELGIYFLKRALEYAQKGYPPNFNPEDNFKEEVWHKIKYEGKELPNFSNALVKGMIDKVWIEIQIEKYEEALKRNY